MVIINIKDYDVFYINHYKQKIRNLHMKQILEEYWLPNKIHRVEAVMDDKKYNGVTMAHMVCLYKGIRLNNPFIVLEDDVNIWEFPQEIELPYIPKALYLGISGYGDQSLTKDMINKGLGDKCEILGMGAMVKNINNLLYRPLNMFGGHATLYFEKEYIYEVLGLMNEALISDVPHDVLLPHYQIKYKLLGLRQSVFYQDSRIGGQEKYTKIKI